MEYKELPVYKFNELDETIQDYLIEKEQSFLIEHCFDQDMQMLKADIVNPVFGENMTMRYSLSYSQGDGVCLDGDIDLKTLLASNTLTSVSQKLLKRLTHFDALHSLKYVQNSRYCHYSTSYIDVIWQCNEPKSTLLHQALEQLLHEIDNLKADLCYQLEKWGYDLDYFESAQQHLIDLDQDYLASGTAV